MTSKASKTPSPSIVESQQKLIQWMGVFMEPKAKTGDNQAAKKAAFREMRTWWDERAPKVPRQRLLNGQPTVVDGWDVPLAVRTTTLDRTVSIQGRAQVLRQSLLHVAVSRKASKLTEWALLCGWDPNLYTGRVTPVGQAMYTGDVAGLMLMRDFGADLVMTLRAEHGTPERPVLPQDVGTTALHRVMAKSNAEIGGRKAEIVQVLIDAYPDPLPRTAEGLTPLDVAVDTEGVFEIRREIARREQLALTEWARREVPLDDAPGHVRNRL